MSFYNYLVDYTLVDNGAITEPVTLAEAKNYCRVTTNADDALINDLITQSREAIEKATGLCITSKNVTIWFNNPAGNIEIPFGPINQTTFKLYDVNNGTEILAANYFLTGDKFPSLNFPIWNKLKATYTSGYSSVPKDLKVAILDQIDFDYENRGADTQKYDTYAICQKAWRACQRYTRISPIL